MRQNMSQECIDQERNDIIGNVNEELMPPLRLVILMVESDGADDELTSQQASGCHQGDPTGDVDPSGDPGEDGDVTFP